MEYEYESREFKWLETMQNQSQLKASWWEQQTSPREGLSPPVPN